MKRLQAMLLATVAVALPGALAPTTALAGESLSPAVALAPAATHAQDVAPDVVLKAVTLEVIAFIKAEHAAPSVSVDKVTAFVESRILPLFDFPRMTQIAMGRNWSLATPAQQKALTHEFRTLLVRTYSVALSSYHDQIIEYKPLRTAPGAAEVTVKSEVKQAGAERMTIDYDMEKTVGGWKVYDVKIIGLSLVTTYRSTFVGRVRDVGIDGLIKALADKNQQNALKS